MPLRLRVFALLLPCVASFSSIPEDKNKYIYVVRHGEKIDGDIHATPTQLGGEAQCLSQKGWARAYNLKSIFGPNPREGFPRPDRVFSCNYEDPLDCRDHNGAFRTEQLIAPVAAFQPGGLHVHVNNQLGFLPWHCKDDRDIKWNPKSKPGYKKHKAGEVPCEKQCEPYFSMIRNWTDIQEEDAESDCWVRGFGAEENGLNPDVSGMCCNEHAAFMMLKELQESDVTTILVAWEHANIGYLATALSGCEPIATSQTSARCAKGGEFVKASQWPDHDYDRIYKLTYNANGEWVKTDKDLFQGFDYASTTPSEAPDQVGWLGPKTYCGAIKKTNWTGNPYEEMTAADVAPSDAPSV